MIPHTNQLNEVVVYANNPRTIIEKAIEKIPVNYSANRNMLPASIGRLCRKGAVISVYRKLY